MEALSRSAQYIANFEPLTLLAALAAVTERIGLVATASTSYNEPFHVARKFASLDHISGGRAGWNLVTSGDEDEAHNFGRDAHLRARRALRPRARVRRGRRRAVGQLGRRRLHARQGERAFSSIPTSCIALNHKGEHFPVRGPLNVPRPPQGRPVIVQAGASRRRHRVAAAASPK